MNNRLSVSTTHHETSMPNGKSAFRITSKKVGAVLVVVAGVASYLQGRAHACSSQAVLRLFQTAIDDANRGLSEGQVLAHVTEENLRLPEQCQLKTIANLEVITKGALGLARR